MGTSPLMSFFTGPGFDPFRLSLVLIQGHFVVTAALLWPPPHPFLSLRPLLLLLLFEPWVPSVCSPRPSALPAQLTLVVFHCVRQSFVPLPCFQLTHWIFAVKAIWVCDGSSLRTLYDLGTKCAASVLSRTQCCSKLLQEVTIPAMARRRHDQCPRGPPENQPATSSLLGHQENSPLPLIPILFPDGEKLWACTLMHSLHKSWLEPASSLQTSLPVSSRTNPLPEGRLASDSLTGESSMNQFNLLSP